MFLIFLQLSATLHYVWKIYYRNDRNFFFTKLLQNVCLIDIRIFMYHHARCDCKLWNALWFYYVFVYFFIHFWQTFMSEVLYLHQNFTNCVFNQYTYFNVLIYPDTTTSYRRFILPHVIACYESVYGIKINLCKHLWLRQSSFMYVHDNQHGKTNIEEIEWY